MIFEAAFQQLVVVEGGYGRHPDDSGRATRWGITEATARANGYRGDMRQLPLAEARRIYRAQYWDLMRLDEVAAHSPRIAEELFDTGVNAGCAVGVTALQRLLNVLNLKGSLFADQRVDGLMGPMTLAALGSFLQRRGPEGERVLFVALNGLQAAGYVDLAERREKDESFVYGWLRARVADQVQEDAP